MNQGGREVGRIDPRASSPAFVLFPPRDYFRRRSTAEVISEGTVCGLGKAKIHVKSTDGSNLTATCHVDVRALPTANIEAPATRLYTAAGHLHLTLPTATAVNVYNLTGTLVRTFIAPAGTSSIALSQGVYVVRAGTHTEKVFVD